MAPGKGIIVQKSMSGSPVLASDRRSGLMDEYRRDMRHILKHPLTEVGISICVFSSLWILVLETDEAAPTRADFPGSGPSLGVMIMNKVFIGIFTVEIIMWLFADRQRYLNTNGIINCLVTLGDLILDILDHVLPATVPGLAVFRCFRLLRLLRLVRLVKLCPELNFMLQGIYSAIMNVVWGTVFIGIIVFCWSLLGVQILHPINLDVEAMGIYDGCPRCGRAFSSVWNSILTLSQTLLFGDSWGLVALPIIEEKWWTLAIFVGAFATITLAAMNLILASIVESGAQAREAALQSRSEKARLAEAEERRKKSEYLMQLCKDLDSDESGRLSKEELLTGFDCNPDFRQAVAQLKFERADIEVLFNILDRDNSNDVDYSEFLDVMEQTQGAETHQMIIFMKFAVMDLWQKREHEDRRLHRRFDELQRTLEARMSPMCLESCASEVSSSQATSRQSAKPPLQAPAPARGQQPPPRQRSKAALDGPKGSPRQRTEDGEMPPKGITSAAKKDPRKFDLDEVLPELAGTWKPLEASGISLAVAPDSSCDSRLHQDLVRVMKKVAFELERHSRILDKLDRSTSSPGPNWKPFGGAENRWAAKEEVRTETVLTETVTFEVGGGFDGPPPPPPSAHGRRPTQEFRVGL